MSQIIKNLAAGPVPPSVPTSFHGDNGTAVPVANIINFTALPTGNNSTQFFASGNTVTLEFEDVNGNTIINESGSAATITTAGQNVGLGGGTFRSLTTGNTNVAVGSGAAFSLTTGSNGTYVGTSAGSGVTTGSNNAAFGSSAGNQWHTSESNNIAILSTGVTGESNVTRIGSVQTKFLAAGITGVTAVGSPVAVSSTGQLSDLGFGTVGQILVSNGPGVSPTWSSTETATSYVNVTNGMSPYTATATDYFISVDATGGPVTINLPDTTTANREFVIKDRLGQAQTNNITVKSLTGASTVDGQASYTFTDNYESLECLFHGANYEGF